MFLAALVLSTLYLATIADAAQVPSAEIPCRKSREGCSLEPGNPAYGICCGRCVPVSEDWGWCDASSRGNGNKARGNGLGQFNGAVNAGGQFLHGNSGDFTGRNTQQFNSGNEYMNAARDGRSKASASQQQANEENSAFELDSSADSQYLNAANMEQAAASNTAANLAQAGQAANRNTGRWATSHHSSSRSNSISKSEQQKHDEQSRQIVTQYLSDSKAPLNNEGTGSGSGFHHQLQFPSENQ